MGKILREGKEKKNRILGRLEWISKYGRKYIWAMIVFTVLGMSSVGVGILSGFKSKDLVDIITGGKTGEVIKTFLLLIIVQLATVLLTNLSNFLNGVISNKVENEIKADVYDEIMDVQWEELCAYHSGQIGIRWGSDTTTVANGILSSIPNLIIYIFKFSASLAVVLRYDASFAIFSLACVPLSFFVSRKNMKRFKSLSMESMEVTGRMTSFTQESFSNYQNVKALDMIDLYKKRLREIQKESFDINLKNRKIQILNALILTLVSQLITYSTYGWGIYRVWSGAISYGTMTMFLTLAQSLSASAQMLINTVPSFISLTNAAQRLMDILDLPREDYSQKNEVKEFFDEKCKAGVSVCLDNISFEYKNGNQVFTDTDFKAAPREIVGVIGPSGEGKTTLLRLLLAIISAKGGDAYLLSSDGSNDRIQITASSRQLFAYVPQGNTLFSGTIADNIRNVKPDISDEEIVEALKISCAWDFVSKSSDGINTMIKERGVGFSEGQLQRISIARAIARKSPVLLLDEATSALDVETEKRLLNNILEDKYPRTCIVTTHRKAVMDICDRVYDIKKLKTYEL